MIEKIKYGWESGETATQYIDPARYEVYDKINELVDVVNDLQATLDAYTKRFRELDDESMQKITKNTQNAPNIVKNSHLFQGNEQKDHKIRSTNERLRKALDCAIDTLDTVYGLLEDNSNIETYIKCKRTEINGIIKGGKDV